tara:strand:- start:73 stop:291 length:219 start_codon:yes stop_codon:yes gene_type:complete
MFAIPNTNTKKLKKTSIITNSLPEIDNGTISPKPTDEKVIKLKYRNSKNCRKNELLDNVANLKFSEFKRYNA